MNFKNNSNKDFHLLYSHINHPVLNDLFNNKFDLSWHYGKDKQTTYSIVPGEFKPNDDGTVKYTYNSEYFRSEEFTKVHNGLHILFSGCSETEGIGGNIEDSWGSMLYNKLLQKNKCSGFFNLARAGWGWNKIILNCLIYFNKYGYPDILFVLLPNVQRKFEYSLNEHVGDNGESIGHWKYIQKYVSDKPIKDSNRIFSNKKEYNEDFIDFLVGWKMFNKICKDNNIKLFFSTWDPIDYEYLKHINLFDNFCFIRENEDEYAKKYYLLNKPKKTDIKKRDGHSGVLAHYSWSEHFYKNYEESLNDKNI